MTKSSELAEEKLRALSDFAARAPFELPAIIEAGVTLEAFGAKAENLIQPLGDLAAFMGLDIVEASQAFGRAFAAGAGAADILRERGVLTLIKLQTGIEDLTKLTLPEFREAMLEAMTDPGGKIFGATERLAETFTGQVSMMSDAIFRLKTVVGDALLPAMKELVTNRIVPLINRIIEWFQANEQIIRQRFEEAIKKILTVIKELTLAVTSVTKSTVFWLTENKKLVASLTKLLVAGLVAAKVISLAQAVKELSIVIGVAMTALTGAGGLVVGLAAAAIAFNVAAAAIAGFVAFELGSILSDWIAGLDDLRDSVKGLNEAVDKNNRVMKLSALATRFGFKNLKDFISTIDKLGLKTVRDFTSAVAMGKIVFDDLSKSWIKAGASAAEISSEFFKFRGEIENLGVKFRDFIKLSIERQRQFLISIGLIKEEVKLSKALQKEFDKVIKISEDAGKSDLALLTQRKTNLVERLRVENATREQIAKAEEALNKLILMAFEKEAEALGKKQKQEEEALKNKQEMDEQARQNQLQETIRQGDSLVKVLSARLELFREKALSSSAMLAKAILENAQLIKTSIDDALFVYYSCHYRNDSPVDNSFYDNKCRFDGKIRKGNCY
jgi:hypothetical protein